MRLYSFILTLAVLLAVNVSLSAETPAPKPKEKVLQLADNVIYKGLVAKKAPAGEGALGIYYTKDQTKMDVISGNFNGGRVTNAVLMFSHDGPVFIGDMIYEIKSDCIEYTLISGILKGEYTGSDYNTAQFSFAIKEPVVISRSLSSFKLKPATVSTIATVKAREYKSIDPDVPYSGPTLLQRAYYLAETLENSYGVTQTYPVKITLSGINDVKGTDGYYSCDKFDLPNGTYIQKEGQSYQLKNSKNAFSLSSDHVSLKKAFKDGVIQYDSHVIFNFGKSATHTTDVLKQISEYLTPENQAILSEIEYLPKAKNSRIPTSFLKVESSDGRIFYGELRPQGLKSYGPTATIDYILALDSVDSCLQQELLSDGVLIYPDGRQELYVNCHTHAELVKYNQEKIKEAAEAELAQEKIRQKNLRFASLEQAFYIPLKGNIKSLELQGGFYVNATFNESGQVLQSCSGEGLFSSTTRYFFKSNGQIDYATIRDEDEEEGTTATFKDVYYYDDNGNVSRVERYKYGSVVSYKMYSYDSLGNCLQCEQFEGRSRISNTSFQYDKKGNLVKKTDGNGETVTYSYDSAGSLTKEVSSVSITKYKHDSLGNVVEAEVYDAFSGEPYYGFRYVYTYRE